MQPEQSAADGAKRGLFALAAMTVLAVGLLSAPLVVASMSKKKRNGRRRR